ncbi:MAG: extensin family protein [Myxococcales bacterium]|nr:extensin family protein [Myxococcales bacterium]
MTTRHPRIFSASLALSAMALLACSESSHLDPLPLRGISVPDTSGGGVPVGTSDATSVDTAGGQDDASVAVDGADGATDGAGDVWTAPDSEALEDVATLEDTGGSEDGGDVVGPDDTGADGDEPGDLGGPPDVETPVDVETPDTSVPDTNVPDTNVPDTSEPDPTLGLNAGFIGGLCGDASECDYASAVCLTSGFPDGLCTQACDKFCPDAPGMATTFCIDAGSEPVPGAGGMCTMRCDFGASPTGCRPGYVCSLMPRHNEPATKVLACVPDNGQGADLSECQQALLDMGVPFEPASSPNDHPEGHPELTCIIEDPIRIGPTIFGIDYRYDQITNAPGKMFVACELALAIATMTAELAVDEVTDVLHLGTYNCRVIAGTSKISQHGLATAIDIAGVGFGDGTVWTVLGHWEDGVANPVTAAGKFLKGLVQWLYDEDVFNILLTPEYNAAHDNHFHLDLTPGGNTLN